MFCMKRLILYDLDGTLVDTLEDLTVAANHMLRMLQAPPVSSQEVGRAVGRGVHELVRSCLKSDDPKRLAYGVDVFRAYYARHLLDRSQLYPGAQEALEHFKDRHQAVITNKPEPFSREILERLGVAGYFVEVIGGDANVPKKPDPAAVLALMQRHGVVPAETLLIGDSPIDVETGRNAGVMVVGVAHGLTDEPALAAARPDALVKNFQALLERAQQEGW